MHLLTRTLNRLNLMMEVSDYQVAAVLVGLPTEITTSTFTYFSAAGAIAICRENLNLADLSLADVTITHLEDIKILTESTNYLIA